MDNIILNEIILPTSIIAAGTSKSGKSWLIRWLLKLWCMNAKFELGLVFTGTRFNGDYTSFLPGKYVIDGFDENILYAWLEKMKKLDDRTADEIDDGVKCTIPHTFVVLDDILDQMNLRSKKMKSFFAT